MKAVRDFITIVAAVANGLATSSREFAKIVTRISNGGKVEVEVRVWSAPSVGIGESTSSTAQSQTNTVQRFEPEVGRIYTMAHGDWMKRCFYVNGVTQTEEGRMVFVTNICGGEETIRDWSIGSPEPIGIWQKGMILECPWQHNVYAVVACDSASKRSPWMDVALTDGHSWWVPAQMRWQDLLTWPLAGKHYPMPLPYLTPEPPQERYGSRAYIPLHPRIRELAEDMSNKNWIAPAEGAATRLQYTKAPWQLDRGTWSHVHAVDGDIVEGAKVTIATEFTGQCPEIHLRLRLDQIQMWPWCIEASDYTFEMKTAQNGSIASPEAARSPVEGNEMSAIAAASPAVGT
jgi:hypothetical protein